jgi:hypothetical protein
MPNSKALFGSDGRRCHLDRMTPAERLIHNATEATDAVDKDDPRIREAVELLWQARARLADYVDGVA